MLPIDDNVPVPMDDPLELKANRTILAERILADIDNYCVTEYGDGHRKHLGASLIGDKCKRKLWFVFRWVLQEKFNGRMMRLFNRGHREEERFVEWLRGIGATVSEFQEDGVTQYRVVACGGHFGGSLDGQGSMPELYHELFGGVPLPAMLLEFKTKGTGAGFNKLKKEGVQLTNPQHYGQMCVYGVTYGYKYALYITINKNDDDMHVEIVPLNWELGISLTQKANDIIYATQAPERCSESPEYLDCKWCAFQHICHRNAPVEVNCRSCRLAQPLDGKVWFCQRYQQNIPEEHIPVGCDGHTPIY